MTTYHILFYKTAEDYLEKRAPYRTEHLGMLESLREKDAVVLGGALAEPADGALIVFRTAEAAREFATNDPYVKNGLIAKWEVRPWSVVIGESLIA